MATRRIRNAINHFMLQKLRLDVGTSSGIIIIFVVVVVVVVVCTFLFFGHLSLIMFSQMFLISVDKNFST